MIQDLMKLKKQVDIMIETYIDLHPEEYEESHDRGNNIHLDGMDEYNQRQTALKRVREGYYENKFSESKGKKTPRSSKGQSSLCVYGDT